MRDVLSVLTCRRRVSYLDATIASLEKAGATEDRVLRMICSDGPIDKFTHNGWRYLYALEPVGNLRKFFDVLEFARAYSADRLFYFEDDVVLCKNAIARMQSVGVPEHLAFVSYFDMKEVKPHQSRTPALLNVPVMGLDGQGFWGLQAVVFPKRTMDYLLANRAQILDEAGGEARRHQSDYFMGQALLRSPWPTYGVHVPNLVQHVGELSAVNKNAATWKDYRVNRRSTCFWGEHIDAEELATW